MKLLKYSAATLVICGLATTFGLFYASIWNDSVFIWKCILSAMLTAAIGMVLGCIYNAIRK